MIKEQTTNTESTIRPFLSEKTLIPRPNQRLAQWGYYGLITFGIFSILVHKATGNIKFVSDFPSTRSLASTGFCPIPAGVKGSSMERTKKNSRVSSGKSIHASAEFLEPQTFLELLNPDGKAAALNPYSKDEDLCHPH